ncbi:MAG: hypothetical protein PWP23_3297 [Candidatus Sumerlaeota bacterium]|nr:hypothetical protein [Candidatus Sumerlaeota bacterium]
MTFNFQTENLIFVPPSARLAIIDVCAWRRIVVDTPGASVRMKAEAIPQLDLAIADVLNEAGRKKSLADRIAPMRLAAEAFVDSLREATPDTPLRSLPLAEPVEGLTFWVRLSDQPAESFFVEDYDEAHAPAGEPALSMPAYGSCGLAELDDLEVPFPLTGAEAAFEILLPREGLGAEPLPTMVPLPLVEEFCGALGVSARGNSVNVTTQGELAPAHMGCLPLGRVGARAFATLYFTLDTDASASVTARLVPTQVPKLEAILARSHFECRLNTPKCRIHVRGGDIVHVYQDLDGKESAGVTTMPPFVLAAAADGSLDPEARSAFLRQLMETAGG